MSTMHSIHSVEWLILLISSSTALPKPYTGLAMKTLYVRSGDVAAIPCDYQPGRAHALYSVSWVRNQFTTVNVDSPPYQGISASDYSLSVLTGDSSRGTTYQCSVHVIGCDGACISPSPRTESGATVVFEIVGM